MVYIETERLILRSWKPEDLPLFIAMNKDEQVMRYFPAILSDGETMAFYKRIQDEFNQKGWGLYAVEIKSTGEFIGYVVASMNMTYDGGSSRVLRNALNAACDSMWTSSIMNTR